MLILNEVYFGETYNIKQIQNCLSKLRAKYTIKSKSDDINNDPIISNISTLIGEEFGFFLTYFMCDDDDNVAENAYTIPIRQDNSGMLDKKYEVTKHGIRYKSTVHTDVIILITKPLLFSKKITDRELMAALLHEIGHNFFDAVVPIETFVMTLNRAISFNITSLSKFLHNKMDINSEFLDDMLNNLKNPIFKSYKKGTDPLVLLSDLSFQRGYSNEKFADSIAVMYGYSKELTSLLTKLYVNSNYPNTSKFFNLLHAIQGLVKLILPSLLGPDPHPVLSARIKSSIAVLQNELDTNKKLPHSLRVDLQNQITTTKILADQYSKINKKDNYIIANKMYFKFLYKYFDKGDIISTFINDKYNLKSIIDTLESKKS